MARVRPTTLEALDWGEALQGGRIVPLTSPAVLTVAVGRLIAVRAENWWVQCSTTSRVDWKVAEEIGLSPSAVRELRLGSRHLKSAEADLVMSRAVARSMFVRFVIDGFASWQNLLLMAPNTVSRVLQSGQCVHHQRMSTSPSARLLDDAERQAVAARVASDLTALATGHWPTEAPQPRPEQAVDWKRIVAEVTGSGSLIPPPVRGMVRAVVEPGEVVANGVITARVHATFGDAAASSRAISDAITGLRRTGELRALRYGLQQVTQTIRRKPLQ